MSDWDWVTTEGAVGELPVKVLAKGDVQFLLDPIENLQLAEVDNRTDHDLRPGDVCILTVQITDVAARDPVTVGITISDVEFLQRATDREADIDAMMKHLEDAKENWENNQQAWGCENCQTIDQSTKLAVETKIGGRDLHYCAECGRLLSKEEFYRWRRTSQH